MQYSRPLVISSFHVARPVLLACADKGMTGLDRRSLEGDPHFMAVSAEILCAAPSH
jgi:hypothetical protein